MAPKKTPGTRPHPTSILLSPEQSDLLRKRAKANERTLTAEIRLAIRKHLAETVSA